MVPETGTWVAQYSRFFWGVKSGLVAMNLNSASSKGPQMPALAFMNFLTLDKLLSLLEP